MWATLLITLCVALAQPAPERVLVLDPGEPGTQYNRHVVHSDETDYVVIPVRGRCMVIYTSPSGVSPTEEVPAVAQRKCAITIPAAQVGMGGVTDFSVLLQRVNLPDEMCSPTDPNAAQANGGDIRFYSDAALTSRLACDIIAFGHDTSHGAGDAAVQIRVKVPSLSSVVDNTIYVSYNQGEAETQPAAGDAYGQYAAYDANWVGYWPLTDLNDRTSNANHLTAYNTPTSGAAGKVGQAYTFDATQSEYLELAGAPVTAPPCTIMAWAKSGDVTDRRTVAGLGATTGTLARSQLSIAFGGNQTGDPVEAVAGRDDGGTATATAGTYAADTWTHLAGIFESNSSRYASKDGVWGAQNTLVRSPSGLDRFRVAYPGYLYKHAHGSVNEVQLHSVARSAAWITTEYNQTNDPAAFATPGTPEDVGVGEDYNTIPVDPDRRYCIYTIGGTRKYLKGFVQFPLPDLAGGTFVSATLAYDIHPLTPGTLDVNVHTMIQEWDGSESVSEMDGWSLGSAFDSYTVPFGASIIPKSHDVTDFIETLYGLAATHASFAFVAPTITDTPALKSVGVTLGQEEQNDKEFHDFQLVITYLAADGGIFAFYSGAFN